MAILIRKLKWCQMFFQKFILSKKQTTGMRIVVINLKIPNIIIPFMRI